MNTPSKKKNAGTVGHVAEDLPQAITERKAKARAKAETVVAELVTLMRTLKPSATEDELQGYAHAIQLGSALSSMNNLPRAQEKGGAHAKRELQAVSRQAAALAQAMFGLHSEALRAFESVETDGRLHPHMLMDTLVAFATAADRASGCAPQTTGKKGRPVDAHAMQVKDLALKIFKALTGRPARRATDPYNGGRTSGPAYEFLCKVFSILGIKASADRQMRLG